MKAPLVHRTLTVWMQTILLSGLFLSRVTAGGDDATFPKIRKILQDHCSQCHDQDTQEGNLDVAVLSSDFSNRDNANAWLEVRTQINLGQMPPAEEPQPDSDEISTLSNWITTRVREAAKSQRSSDGRVLLRRMNRYEYTNTIADLLRMRFPEGESPLDSLPPDGTSEGFDKVSSALLLDPSLMEMYYKVARRIADRAIVDGPPAFPTEKMRLEFEDIADSRAIGYLVTRLGMNPVPGGLELIEGQTRSFGMLRYPGRQDNNVAPVNGFYRFTLRAGGAPGLTGELPKVALTHSHPDDAKRNIMEIEIDALWDAPREYSVILSRDTLGGELQVRMLNDTKLHMGQRPGENFMRRISQVGEEDNFSEVIRLTGRKVLEGWGGERSTPDPSKLDTTQFPRAFLDYLEVEGPLYDQWPPQSHTTLLFDADASEDLGYAREIFARFLPRAWRRPVEEYELEPILQVVRTELENGADFRSATRVGLATVLTSPKFLFLSEPSADTSARRLNSYEIASRLSYFLWNSMPDEELFQLAETGRLAEEEVLRRQVDRMLSDPKSQRFTESFARQWLRTDTFLAFTPAPNLYRQYDEKLAKSIVREPLEFFQFILANDLSVLNFINSDFLVLNERLAKHYEIPGVEGEAYQRVSLPVDSVRGGLLAMAGVHQAGSDGVRTKPVARAVYVREVILNDPPDPPPPNAGEIEPNIRGQNLTIRERLLEHQQIESCASCHRNLDPYGLALENFNVIGLWREQQDGEDFRSRNAPVIDAHGQLPNGQQFSNFFQFRQLLSEQGERFRRGLAERLLVYALGRPVEPSDDAVLTRAVIAMNNEGDTLRSLIQSMVTSQTFLEK